MPLVDHGSCVHVMLATNLLQYTYKYGAVWYRWELLPDRDMQNANWLATTTKNTNNNHGNAIDSPEKSMSRSARDEKAESCVFFFMVSFTFFFSTHSFDDLPYCTRRIFAPPQRPMPYQQQRKRERASVSTASITKASSSTG